MGFTIRTADAVDEQARRSILGPLIAYNETETARNDFRPIMVAIHDDSGDIVGGLVGRTAYDWLFVELVFVPESMRGQGMGTDLMRRAEEEAATRGCHSAWLDTFEFQGRAFYKQLGYICFGELGDYPVESSRYFMRKVLAKPGSGTPLGAG
jgi:GNAT superfamily N-acetyltransferase